MKKNRNKSKNVNIKIVYKKKGFKIKKRQNRFIIKFEGFNLSLRLIAL
jgi:hypothetical protein